VTDSTTTSLNVVGDIIKPVAVVVINVGNGPSVTVLNIFLLIGSEFASEVPGRV
jgi:hypothetical protein